MIVFFKYFWLFFIVATCVNAFILKHRFRKYIAEKPELKEGYDKIFKGILVYGNIPWIIMGLGMLFGLTESMFDFFQPRRMNIIVLIFHLSIIVLWVLGTWWIYFNNGAEFIEKHPGFMRSNGFSGRRDVTAKQVKIFYPLMLLGGIVGMIMMWVVEIPPLPELIN